MATLAIEVVINPVTGLKNVCKINQKQIFCQFK